MMDYVHIRGTQYRTNNILIPYGDDFRWIESEAM